MFYPSIISKRFISGKAWGKAVGNLLKTEKLATYGKYALVTMYFVVFMLTI